MKKSWIGIEPPDVELRLIIPGKTWIKLHRVSKYMGLEPEQWILKRIKGQLSRFHTKGGNICSG
jgi:hypothetical protein